MPEHVIQVILDNFIYSFKKFKVMFQFRLQEKNTLSRLKIGHVRNPVRRFLNFSWG